MLRWASGRERMEQRSVLTRPTQPQARQPTIIARWMQYFFAGDLSSGKRFVSDLQRRACWIGLALLLQSLNEVDQGITTIDRTWLAPLVVFFDALLPLALILGSFWAMWLALRPASLQRQSHYARRHPALWQHVILATTLLLAIIGGVLGSITLAQCFLPPQFGNDGTSLDTNAAILLLHGRNPYSASSILDVARRFGIQPTWTTPLRQGQFARRLDYPTPQEFQAAFAHAQVSGQAPEFESRVSYPPLAFLTLVPFVFLNQDNVLPFYLLSYLLIIVIAWKVARPQLRPWVLLLGLANIPMWGSTMGGNLDIFAFLLLILAWLLRDQRWRSALLLGLAVASKQIAWLFLPFYLIMVWRHVGFKEMLSRLLITGSLALAINLSFMLWNPQAWLAGILAPVMDPMFPLGVGFITLSITHLLPYFPTYVYALLEGVTMLGALACYWRICRQHPEAAMLLAVVPLLFAWRSLPSYFCCAAYPLFLLTAARMRPAMRRVLVVAEQRLPAFAGVYAHAGGEVYVGGDSQNP